MTVKSYSEGWHVYFPKGRKDFLSGIEDGGTIFHYYEGREDDLKSVNYESGYVHFYKGKPLVGFWSYEYEEPLWVKEYDWENRWYHKNYEIGEHNYNGEE